MTKPPITSIAPWFGSKRMLAPYIVTELGPHTAYFEPFCGSCAVLFAKSPVPHETVCDLHADLINLARVLASDSAIELYQRASRILPSTELYLEFRDTLDHDNPIDRALRFLIISWLGRNGTAGTRRQKYQPAVRYSIKGGSTPARWRSVLASLPWWHERLQNVQILHTDAFSLLANIPDRTGVAIYVDPPYVQQSRSPGGTRYQHDFSDHDHTRLATVLSRFQLSRVVLSYYDCQTVRDLYSDWTIIPHTTKKLLARHCRHDRNAPELLILNGPSYDHSTRYRLFPPDNTHRTHT